MAVKEIIINYLNGLPSNTTEKVDALNNDTSIDIFSHGVIDSFGFLELILHLETETGISMDFTKVAPETLTTINALCNYFEEQ